MKCSIYVPWRIAAGLFLSLIMLCGCSSVGVKITPVPQNKMTVRYPYKLYIRKINFIVPAANTAFSPRAVHLKNIQEVRGRIKMDLEKKYPHLFPAEVSHESALPLNIEIGMPENKSSISIINNLIMLCSFGLIPSWQTNTDFDFQIKISAGTADISKKYKTNVVIVAGWFSPLCVSRDDKQIYFRMYNGRADIDLLLFKDYLRDMILETLFSGKDEILQEHIRKNS